MQNKCVRDLAWVINSPSLIEQKADWPVVLDAAKDNWSDQWLSSLDQAPSPLLHHLSQEKSHFLGTYFESLWAFYLISNPKLELIAKNLQANSTTRTEGEFDFIVLDKESGRYIHQEIAIKFYLGFRKENHYHFSDGLNIWLGPQCRDRLDLKMDKMVNSQVKLSTLESGKKALRSVNINPDVSPISTQILIKGYLFYPPDPTVISPTFCNPDHLEGLWFTLKEFTSYLNKNSFDAWAILTKTEWVSAYFALISDQPLNLLTDKLEMLDAIKKKVITENRPWMIACLTKKHNHYTEEFRLFVVPDNWPYINTAFTS